MALLAILFLSFSALYAFATVLLMFAWINIPSTKLKAKNESIAFTVVIAARNEAENIEVILRNLSEQSYQNFEILVVNDNSIDATEALVTSVIDKLKLNARLLSLSKDKQGKKAAITLGVENALGEYIITTDADCSVGKEWISTFAGFIQNKKAKFISAPVTFYQEKSLFEKLQTVEFMSLIGAGGIFMHWKKPNMCNGANICYEKKVFHAVNGFEGNELLASGDDEFLMHKIAATYPKDVLFLKDKEALVKTMPQPSIAAFFQQRKRWASKWKHYKNMDAVMVAIIVFSFHLTFCIIPFCFLLGLLSLKLLLVCFGLKILAEIGYIATLLNFTNQSNRIILIPLVAVLHPYYVVLFGLVANFGKYKWKERTLS